MGKRFFMGMLSGAGSVAIKHLLNILLLPVLIHSLGVELFGLYMLLVGIQELCLLLDLGFTDAVVKLLSATHEGMDTSRYPKIMKIGQVLFLSISLLVLIAGLISATFFPAWLHINPDLHPLSQVALALIILEGAVTLYVTYYRAILLSHCLHQWNNVGDTLFNLIGIGLGAGLLVSGYGLIGLLLARLTGALMRAAIVVVQALKVEPQALWPKAQLEISILKDLTGLTFHAMMVNISVIVSHKLDTLVIAAFLPLTAVGFYEIVFRLLGSILQLCMKICDGVFPMFARLMAASNTAGARQLFLRMSSFNNVLVGALMILIVGFYPEVFAFFSAGRMSIEPTLPILAIAVPIIWSSALQIPACYFLYTADRQRYLTLSSLITAGCNLILSLILVQPLGIVGVALGTLIPQVIQHQLSLIPESCRTLNVSLEEYLKAVHLKALLALALLGFSVWLLKPLALLAPIPIIPIAILGGLLFSGVLFLWFTWTASEQEKSFFVLKIIGPLKNRLTAGKVALNG